MTSNNNNSKLNLTAKLSSSLSKRSSGSYNRLLFFEEYGYHFQTKGKLIYDIVREKLKFVARGEISEYFKRKYGDEDEFEILKSNINSIDISNVIKEGVAKFYFRVTLKKNGNSEEKIFSFVKNENKNAEKIRDKFYNFLKNDNLTIYKSEFGKMNIETQKKIGFIMKNRDFLILYKTLSKNNFDPETIFNYIKFMHPERININLGFNRIQLSRDEELIMAINFGQRQFNVKKLILSDKDIYKKYYEEIDKKNFKKEEFWNNFYNNQKEYKTYLVGEYNPSFQNNNDNDDMNEVNDSNLMEELEKDKYYYDNYETNYLYYDEKDDINSIKATINNYSMNKMKEINYFSYSPISINLYKNKSNNKNRISKKNTNVYSNMNKNMEIETDYNKKEIKTNKRMSKTELKNKISQMKKEYEQRKDKKNNINNTTTKTLTEEADKVYYLTEKMNFLDNKADDIKDIYDKLFLIRDLSFIFKHENYSLEKMKDKLVSNSKREKINSIKTEIKNIISDIHKKYGQRNNFPIVRFLLKYAENNSLN